MTRPRPALLLLLICSLCAGCATNVVKNYTAFRASNPRSILVVPVLNNTTSVTAADYFLSTVSRPFAERGYYVFPAHMVKRLLEDQGLADPGLVHGADSTRLAGIFGCDAALYIIIERWESQYILISTSTNVEFSYSLKSCRTGEILWEHSQAMTYSPSANSSSGNLLLDLLAEAITAAVERADPNYIPLAQEANALAAATPGEGIPAGPYLPTHYNADFSDFPVR